MRRLTLSLLVALGAICIAGNLASAATVTVQTDPGTIQHTNALAGFDTSGDMMAGMVVSVTFADATTDTATWASTGSGAGGATGTNFTIAESGNTFSSDFTLTNNATQAI